MDYRAFAGAVEKQMNQKMAGGAKAGLYTTTKNNGKMRTAVQRPLGKRMEMLLLT